ncbi:MAG: ROK family protein [Phycicoccus sp.]|nr:ROK family protein [Phycicoccus sp.]
MRLGIDIGGTKTAAIVLAEDGSEHALAVAPSGQGNAGTVTVASTVANQAVDAVGGWRGIRSVGACMPGLVDPHTGVVHEAVNLNVQALDLAGSLEDRLGRRPAVDNDVKAAALGALHTLGPAVHGSVAYVNVGTGLAAAILDDGVVVRGLRGAAGEIGHLPIGTDVVCPCGQRGCLETLASGRALTRLWPRPPAELFPAAAQGDPLATQVVAGLARGIGLAIQLLVLTGAQTVIIGGGVARSRIELAAAVTADLTARAAESAFLRSLELPTRFEVLDGDVPVAAIGAALLDGAAEQEVK